MVFSCTLSCLFSIFLSSHFSFLYLVYVLITFVFLPSKNKGYEVRGVVKFTTYAGDDFAAVEANLSGLPSPGGDLFGLHVHDFGVFQETSPPIAGPHYNPTAEVHGCYYENGVLHSPPYSLSLHSFCIHNKS
jgi:hypothetical protein